MVERAPAGWKTEHSEYEGFDSPAEFDPFPDADPVESQVYKRAWARLLASCEGLRGGSVYLPEMRIGDEGYRRYSGAGGDQADSKASSKTRAPTPGARSCFS